jgi:hypothetical protein
MQIELNEYIENESQLDISDKIHSSAIKQGFNPDSITRITLKVNSIREDFQNGSKFRATILSSKYEKAKADTNVFPMYLISSYKKKKLIFENQTIFMDLIGDVTYKGNEFLKNIFIQKNCYYKINVYLK